MRQTHVTNSAAATVRLGRRIAAALRPGDWVLLRGEMGSGKTTLVRGIAAGLGVDPALVSSPTFVIINEYPGRDIDLIHVDAYRLGGPDDLDSLGWDRLRADAVVVVEWPEKFEGATPAPGRVFSVSLRATGPRSREVAVEAPDAGVTPPASPR